MCDSVIYSLYLFGRTCKQLRILADDPDEFQFNGLGGPSQLVDEETHLLQSMSAYDVSIKAE